MEALQAEDQQGRSLHTELPLGEHFRMTELCLASSLLWLYQLFLLPSNHGKRVSGFDCKLLRLKDLWDGDICSMTLHLVSLGAVII